jgi:hypothetical protein
VPCTATSQFALVTHTAAAPERVSIPADALNDSFPEAYLRARACAGPVPTQWRGRLARLLAHAAPYRARRYETPPSPTTRPHNPAATMSGERAYHLWGFSSLKEYGSALTALPTIVATKSFAPLMPADVIKESGKEMKRCMVRAPVLSGLPACLWRGAPGSARACPQPGWPLHPSLTAAASTTLPPPPAARCPRFHTQGAFELVCLGIGMMLGEGATGMGLGSPPWKRALHSAAARLGAQGASRPGPPAQRRRQGHAVLEGLLSNALGAWRRPCPGAPRPAQALVCL